MNIENRDSDTDIVDEESSFQEEIRLNSTTKNNMWMLMFQATMRSYRW